MSARDSDLTPEGLDRRLVRLETQRNAAVALAVMFAGGLVAGAVDVAQKTTRMDERVTRMAIDVQGATAAIARIDRMEERLTSVGRSVDRIEADVTRTREGVESLRSELSAHRTARAALSTTATGRALARR